MLTHNARGNDESKVSDEQAITVTRQTLQTLHDKLSTCKTNIAALTLPPMSFISNDLSFSIQDTASFETHLENCFNTNGFLISDPQLLNTLPPLSNLPSQLIISTFDTKLLLSKPLSKVVREVQKNREKCSVWTKATKELRASEDCSNERLQSICLNNVGNFTREATFQHQFVFSTVPAQIQSLQDSIKEMSNQIVVHPDHINQIGTHLTAAGTETLTMLGQTLKDAIPLKYSILFYTSLIGDHLRKARILLILSELKSNPTD